MEKLSKENWYSTCLQACHHWSNNLYIWIKLVKYNPANTRFWLKACITAQNAVDTVLAARITQILNIFSFTFVFYWYCTSIVGSVVLFCNLAFTIQFNLQNVPWLHAFLFKTHNSEPCCWPRKGRFIWIKKKCFRSLEITLKKGQKISQLIYNTPTEDSIAILN